MRISFFEEFPTRENLEKLALVRWPTTLYVAARSVREFERVRRSVRNGKVEEVVYWPVLEKQEGYWCSPFSRREALQRVFDELEEKDVPVMIDAELPTTKNPWLYLTEALNFSSNKSLLRRVAGGRKKVYTAEYAAGGWGNGVLDVLGLHFDPRVYQNRVIKMMYHSMRSFNEEKTRVRLRAGKALWGDNFLVGYGVLAPGIEGDEPVLTLSQLERDLLLAKEEGIGEVVIFRLGGLNREYARVMARYAAAGLQ